MSIWIAVFAGFLTMAAKARKSEGYNYTDWYFGKRKL
jgi:hypothetical protein